MIDDQEIRVIPQHVGLIHARDLSAFRQRYLELKFLAALNVDP
jgi:hypothetical protein